VPAFPSAVVRHMFTHQRQRQQSQPRARAGLPAQTSSARQWFALRASVLRLANSLWLLPPRRQPASVKGSAGLDPAGSVSTSACQVFWCQCEREEFGRSASCRALGLAFMLPSVTVPLSESNGVHMQCQGKVVQAQRPYRQDQGQSQPNPSFKRTA
jgi:hypothetical protein